MALTPEQIDAEAFARWGDMKGAPLAMCRGFARAIEIEVRKECAAERAALRIERDHMEMAANAEARRVDELTELRKDADALIRQMLEALENHDGNYKLSKSMGAAVDAAITAAARAHLLDSDLSTLTERGATAWAGVDAQALRGECTLQDFERSMAVRAEGRKPFTPAQQERLYRNRPANVGKSASLAEWRRTVEFVEAAHGITKGGQHGAP